MTWRRILLALLFASMIGVLGALTPSVTSAAPETQRHGVGVSVGHGHGHGHVHGFVGRAGFRGAHWGGFRGVVVAAPFIAPLAVPYSVPYAVPVPVSVPVPVAVPVAAPQYTPAATYAEPSCGCSP